MKNEAPKITLADIIRTPRPSIEESQLLTRKILALEKRDSGSNQPFRLQVGDVVENFGAYKDGHAEPAGTVTELYRENGHNRAATEKGFFREQDLRKVSLFKDPDPWKAWEKDHGIKREIIQPSLFDHGDGFQLETENAKAL